jgi:putative CRISPR-associated protein (TIGR02620 family)
MVRSEKREWKEFEGKAMPGLLAIIGGKYTQCGGWSGTEWTLTAALGVIVVEVLRPFEGWGQTWTEAAEGIKVLVGSYDCEQAARETMPLIAEKVISYKDAINLFIANETVLKGLDVKSESLIVTRHKTLVEWLNKHGVVGDVIAQVIPEDIQGKDIYGILPLWLAAKANSVTEVSMPGLPLEARQRVNGGDYTVDEMNSWGAVLKKYIVREVTE